MFTAEKSPTSSEEQATGSHSVEATMSTGVEEQPTIIETMPSEDDEMEEDIKSSQDYLPSSQR